MVQSTSPVCHPARVGRLAVEVRQRAENRTHPHGRRCRVMSSGFTVYGCQRMFESDRSATTWMPSPETPRTLPRNTLEVASFAWQDRYQRAQQDQPVDGHAAAICCAIHRH